MNAGDFINLGSFVAAEVGPVFQGRGARVNVNMSMLLCGPDENSCTYFSDTGSGANRGLFNTQHGFEVFVVDQSGDYTAYSTGNADPNYNSISSIIPFGGGLYLVQILGGMNLTFWCQLANLRLNNASPIFLKPSLSPLSNACYDANLKVPWYDARKKMLLSGFYRPAGQSATQIFSSAYSVTPGALTLINAGYVGTANPPAAPDPFDLVDNLGALSFSMTLSNGINYGVSHWGAVDNALSRQVIVVDPGITTAYGCEVSTRNQNGANVSASTNDSLPFPFLGGGNNCALGDVSLSRIVGVCNSNNATLLFGGDNFGAYLTWNGYTGTPNFALTKNYLFLLSTSGFPNYYPGQIFKMAIPARLSNGTIASHRGIGLINNARPISLTGKYKA